MRPDYPTFVYSRILKELYPDVPVVIGGIEASMRRLTHYDYCRTNCCRVSWPNVPPTCSSTAWANVPSSK